MSATQPSQHSGENSSSAQTAVEATCAELLLCLRHVKLYPREHSRVNQSLKKVLDLATIARGTSGCDFEISVSDVLENASDDSSATRELAKLLEHRLVERVRFPEKVSVEELYRLCDLLRQDLLGQPEVRDQVIVELNQLTGVKLSFYELQELPAVVEVNSRNHGVEDLLSGLDPEISERLRTLLHTDGIQERIDRLGTALVKGSEAETNHTTVQHLPLLKEILRSAITNLEDDEDGNPDADVVIDGFNHLLTFFERNAESIGSTGRITRADIGGYLENEDMAEFSRASPAFSNAVQRIQKEKEKLAGIFGSRTDSVDAAPHTHSPALASPATRPQARDGKNDNLFGNVETVLAEVSYDFESMAAAVDDLDWYHTYIGIVLELLQQQQIRPSVLQSLESIDQTLTEALAQGHQLDKVLEIASRYAGQEDHNDARELVITILRKMRSDVELRTLLENVVLPTAGESVSREILYTLTEVHRAEAVDLLVALGRSNDPALRELAVERLIGLSLSNKTHLAEWAAADIHLLLDDGVFTRLAEQVGADRLCSSLTEYWSQCQPKEIREFFDELPSKFRGMNRVLLSALDALSGKSRAALLESMHRFESPKVASALREVVKRNNYLEEPDLDEVRAALSSLLVLVEDKASMRFVDQVQNEKHWLRHTFRKEIRRELTALSEASPT